MKIPAIHIGLVLAAALLAACGKGPQPAQQPGQPGEPQAGAAAEAAPHKDAAPGDGNVFAPLENDLQRARGVQDTVNRQAEELKKQIEKAEGATDDGSR